MAITDLYTVLSLTAICKDYRQGTVVTPALTNVSLRVAVGDFVAVMGPSGCGKSTLLNVMGLLDNADSGQYQFDDCELTRLSERAQDRFRWDNIGFVFQNYNLIATLSIYENIELPLLYSGLGAIERQHRVRALLSQLNLLHRGHYRPADLSGGQQQRVALARAVATRPRLLLADEPTGNLDSLNRQVVMRLLADLNEAGTTIIMVTHTEMDAHYAHRIVQMRDGKLV